MFPSQQAHNEGTAIFSARRPSPATSLTTATRTPPSQPYSPTTRTSPPSLTTIGPLARPAAPLRRANPSLYPSNYSGERILVPPQRAGCENCRSPSTPMPAEGDLVSGVLVSDIQCSLTHRETGRNRLQGITSPLEAPVINPCARRPLDSESPENQFRFSSPRRRVKAMSALVAGSCAVLATNRALELLYPSAHVIYPAPCSPMRLASRLNTSPPCNLDAPPSTVHCAHGGV